MKKLYALTILLVFLAMLASAQKSAKQNQRIITDSENGKAVEFSPVSTPATSQIPTESDGKGAVINWQTSDAEAIANYVKVSAQNLKSACA
jgi:hypothetical protein